MNHTLATAIELIEAEAWAQLLLAAPPEWQAQHGIAVSRLDQAALLFARRTPVLPLNRVIGLGCASTFNENALDEVIERYSSCGVKQFVLQWSPAAHPETAMEWFSQRGAKVVSATAKVYRAIEPESPRIDSDLIIEEIEADQASLYEEVVAEPLGVPREIAACIRSTIGQPGWRYYLARAGEEPIAGACCYVQERHAWFGLTATLAAHRGRGAQTALLARRLKDASAAGCAWVSADTLPDTPEDPSQSLRNLLRAGFTMLYERPNVLFDLGSTSRR